MIKVGVIRIEGVDYNATLVSLTPTQDGEAPLDFSKPIRIRNVIGNRFVIWEANTDYIYGAIYGVGTPDTYKIPIRWGRNGRYNSRKTKTHAYDLMNYAPE